eukprot:scaffold20.g7669.t1
MAGPSLPTCSVCTELLGLYGGPVTLHCGHNGCLQCLRNVQAMRPNQPTCPLCRAPFDAAAPLAVNHELADLVRLAAALGSDEHEKERGWQAVAVARGGDGTAGWAAPSAPPAALRVDVGAVLDGDADVLDLEPPVWLPDSAAAACMAPDCGKPFSFLAGTVSRAAAPPVHDVTAEWSVKRALLNPPYSASMEGDLFKAANALRQAAASLGGLRGERGVPRAVFAGAHGLAVVSCLRAGLGALSATVGTGVVVARRADGAGWSAPSSLQLVGSGLGWAAGAALVDVLVVLRSPAAVRAFCGSQIGLGGSAAIAAGPLGRNAGANAAAGLAGGATMLSYSCARGLFAGVALEGSLLRTRDAVNHRFYGRPLSAKALLTSDAVPPPAGAATFYAALGAFMEAVTAHGADAVDSSDAPEVAAAVAAATAPAETPKSPVASLRGRQQQRAWLDVPAAVSAAPGGVFGAQAGARWREEEDAPWGCLFD